MKLVGRITSLIFLAVATVAFVSSGPSSIDFAFWVILLAILVDGYTD